jgi:Histidine kinase-like ATPase domain
MPWPRRRVLTLEIDPEARSVRTARAWVVQQLTAIGRGDLVDAARLGVSELVTNAILHAEPPIVVRLGGSPTHPRVEVHDNSTEPPAARGLTGQARLLATVGRGLGIVAMYSRHWGAEMSARGKVVWFEPRSDRDPADERPVAGEVFDLGGLVDGLPSGEASGGRRVRVELLGMPVQVFAHQRLWFDELRRELRLLALSHGTDHRVSTVAQEVQELTVQVEQERRLARGVDRLDEAIAAGLDRVDLVYDVPASAPATMGRLLGVLEDADGLSRDLRLLTPSPTAQLVALRAWYLGEFARQGRGEPPRPWPGGYTVESGDPGAG